MKISCQEPAERVVSVPLSQAEIVALYKYHTSQIRRITRDLGKIILNIKKGYLPIGRARGMVTDEAEEQVKAHASRAAELHSLLKNTQEVER